MVQSPQPGKLSFDQVLKLVGKLSPPEQEKLRLELNRKSWGQRFDDLSQTIQARFEALGVPVEDEVMAEVKAVRAQRRSVNSPAQIAAARKNRQGRAPAQGCMRLCLEVSS